MSKGFTLMEMVITIVLLTVLGAFTFSVVWQYSQLYADTRKGYISGEAAVALERITRELRDAKEVYTVPFGTFNPARYINFLLTHNTPATGGTSIPAQWVQYCICSNAGSGNSRALLYRIQDITQTDGDYCQTTCPAGANAALMSRNIMSSHSDPNTTERQGFRVQYLAGDVSTVDDDSFEITLALSADPRQNNLLDVSPVTNNASITLVTRVSPRNYHVAGLARRSFNGNYYDQIN